MKNWTVYIEGSKVKAWDLTGENMREVDDLLNALGLKIIAKCAFNRKSSAIDYGKFLESRK